ncbi:hypothetical protein PM082_014100 [Marasmius tenuissimus]|nr:hypothetical protein PM082_014100 [Marasmius tenuissimus]
MPFADCYEEIKLAELTLPTPNTLKPTLTPLRNFPMLPFAKAALIGLIVESIAYGCETLLQDRLWTYDLNLGIYFTVFLRTVPILCRKMAPGFIRAYLVSTALALLVLITLKLGVDTKITVEKFTTTRGVNLITAEEVKLSSAIYVSLVMIADIFIVNHFVFGEIGSSHSPDGQVYRVFAVWSRSLLVSVVPCLLLVGGITSGGLTASTASELAFEDPRSAGFLTAFYSITLALNVLCTGLIASKLYIMERETLKLSSSLRLRWTSVIVIESAALYLACVIVIVACNVVKADGVHLIVLSLTPSIVGLTFSLIIVRIGSGGTPNKTFTSIGDLSRGSVLQFGTGHRTIIGHGGAALND